MGETTGISWCDHTFNPWIGCTKVSPACDGCYAAAMMGQDGRYKRVEWGEPGKGAGTRSRTAPANWKQPRKWNREAGAAVQAWRTNPFARPETPKPSRFVFCASLADVFDNEAPAEWRRDLFHLIRETPHLTWLLLTKRPQMIVKLWAQCARIPDPADSALTVTEAWPPNAAIGTTVEDQTRADQNIPALLAAKAALKPAFAFLSMEPLLSPVDLGTHLIAYADKERGQWAGGIDWVITGGETDQGSHRARPTHPDWLRSIRDQCAAAGVPYHHKQNGEWMPCGESIGEWPVDAPGHVRLTREGRLAEHGWPMQRVGKKFSGRLLDDVQHDAMPAV